MMEYDLSILRLLDANLNRATEGLRVLEESARMLLDNAVLSAKAKNIRHTLAEIIRSEPSLDRALLFARNSETDVLKASIIPSENTRSDVISILHANAKRATESIRSLEEYSKLISPTLGAQFKDVRFAVYSLEQHLVGFLTRSELTASPRIRLGFSLMISQQTPTSTDFLAVARDLKAGYVVLHGETLSDRAFIDVAGKWVTEARKAGVMMFIEHRLDVALASGADGLFVHSDDIPPERCRQIGGVKLLIGYCAEPDSSLPSRWDDIDLFILVSKNLDKLPTQSEVIPEENRTPFLVRGFWTPERLEQTDLASLDGVLIESSFGEGTESPVSLSLLRPVLKRLWM
ncbi:thiamine phosphate synthase [Candidatus Latescibacterota bacterium]